MEVQTYAQWLLRDEPLGQRPGVLLGEWSKVEKETWEGGRPQEKLVKEAEEAGYE